LVNASAAKTGGAKTILSRFVRDFDFSAYDKVFVVAPPCFVIERSSVEHVALSTSGIGTLLFTIFFVRYYIFKYGCTEVFSFNNLNVIGFKNKVTYLHNFHILSKKSFRHYLNRFLIRLFFKRSKFVVQTEFVKKKFIDTFGKGYRVVVNWPGCEYYRGSPLFSSAGGFLCVVPITDIQSTHKNFALISRNASVFKRQGVELLITSDSGPSLDGFKYIGVQDSAGMERLYSRCHFMIFPSTIETVGLPIFEFATTGKPVLVLNAEYLDGVKKTVSLPENIFRFEESELPERVGEVLSHIQTNRPTRICREHAMVKADWSGFYEN